VRIRTATAPDGTTALDTAVANGNDAFVALLREYSG